jgi:hypothetical protein
MRSVLLIVAVWLLVPSVALAAPTWSAPQQLNRGFVNDDRESVPFSSDPYVGVDATGAALVVWSVPRTPGTEGTDVYAAAAPAGVRVRCRSRQWERPRGKAHAGRPARSDMLGDPADVTIAADST